MTVKYGSLPAATGLHHHVLVLFVHHVVGGVYVEDAYGAQSGGHTAGRGGGTGVHGVHESLDDGVVGRLQVRAYGKVANAVAVVRLVLQRRDDPVVPAHLLEVDVQLPPVAPRLGALDGFLAPGQWGPSHTPLGEQVLVDGLVVVARARLDLVIEEAALLCAAEHHEECLLLGLAADTGKAQLPQVRRSTALLHSLQFKADLRHVPEALEQLPDVKHLPLGDAVVLNWARLEEGGPLLTYSTGVEPQDDGVARRLVLARLGQSLAENSELCT